MLVVAEREQLPVAEARAGDTAAWDTLFRRYQLPLYVYVFELVHDEQTSLDIVQETFISAARHIGSLCEDAKFGSWLFGIAHQKCIQRWRKQARDDALREELATAPVEFAEGDGLRFSCDYFNASDQTVQIGESARKEMCFLWGYYYPSTGFKVCMDDSDYGISGCCPGNPLCDIVAGQ